MDIYYTIVSFIFGITLGSFYNVVGYRLPREQSLITPSSHCTSCNHKLNIIDLFPVFSFLLLGGKCRYCKQKISWFYAIFEFLTGLLFLGVSVFYFHSSLEWGFLDGFNFMNISFWLFTLIVSCLYIVAMISFLFQFNFYYDTTTIKIHFHIFILPHINSETSIKK